MKLARWLTVLFFAVTTVFFAFYTIRNKAETDAVPPVISCASDTLEASINADEAALLEDMTAEDNRDGDVTDSLVVVSKSKFMETGKRRVNYAAFDSYGNVATYSRVLTYTDYVSPRFSLSEPLRFNANTWSYSLLDMIRAEDCIDGNISGLIKYKFDGDGLYYGEPSKTGVTFQVTNSAGDTALLPVHVEVLSEEEYAKPYPVLTKYLVYTELYQRLNPRDYLDGRWLASGNVNIEDQVDYTTPGVYEIVYTLTGQGSVTLYVVVEE